MFVNKWSRKTHVPHSKNVKRKKKKKKASSNQNFQKEKFISCPSYP